MFETVFLTYFSLSTLASLLILKDAKMHGMVSISYIHIYFVYIWKKLYDKSHRFNISILESQKRQQRKWTGGEKNQVKYYQTFQEQEWS